MINKWNEVDLSMFEYIFKMYWEIDPSTIDKVLEIQNLEAIKAGCQDIRIYFGRKISINDFKEYNREAVTTIEQFKIIYGKDFITPNINISVCMLEGIGGPKIIPLGNTENHYSIIWSSYFDEKEFKKSFIDEMIVSPMILWFKKTQDERYFPGSSLKDISKDKKYVRIRGMDFKDWKEMMNSYCQTKNIEDLHIEDDIRKDQIF